MIRNPQWWHTQNKHPVYDSISEKVKKENKQQTDCWEEKSYKLILGLIS